MKATGGFHTIESTYFVAFHPANSSRGQKRTGAAGLAFSNHNLPVTLVGSEGNSGKAITKKRY